MFTEGPPHWGRHLCASTVGRRPHPSEPASRHAAKRFASKLRQDHPHHKCIVTEDSLSSKAPHIETLQAHDLHYILGVKAEDHTYLFQQVAVAEHAGRVIYDERHDRAAGLVHRFRLVNDVSLNASNPNVRVNFIAY